MQIDNDSKLKLLNHAQPGQPWQSCDEKRQCIMCERTFRGRDVVVRKRRGGELEVSCPFCDSGPQFWARLGNPLLDKTAWADWERAIQSSLDGMDGGNGFAQAG